MRSRGKVLGVHMIVKNEAARLPALLETIAPFVDQVVVCDTDFLKTLPARERSSI